MSFFTGWAASFPTLLQGLGVSLRLTILSIIIGLPCGLLLALGSSSRLRPLRWLTIAVVEIGRGTPALVVLQIFYFGLPSYKITLSSFVAAMLAISLTTAAYTSEIIRGAIQSVPDGHVEAAAAMGMSRADTLRFVILPQGMRVALPTLMGFAVLIFQMTSLAYTIAVPELLSQGYSIGSSSFRYLSILTLVGLMYAAITVPASALTDRLERRFARHI